MTINSDRPLPRKLSKWWIRVPVILTYIMFVCVAWPYFTKASKSPEAVVEETGVVDFKFLNLRSDDCRLINDAGLSVKEKILKAQEGQTIIIPEGTRIVGDCFLRRPPGEGK
ncbi:hypothetical protein [Pseudomonas syringae]|uniref:hypothetical protein n=1 Tax=Pseudomonas syringae TaxID=317 RepID=UPI00273E68BB|nr:hypothetical protein [Pseudomonas syringae]MDP5168539.1 hypothetical protein [Pseudomonas syringae pv. aptata str. DSM 50252]